MNNNCDYKELPSMMITSPSDIREAQNSRIELGSQVKTRGIATIRTQADHSDVKAHMRSGASVSIYRRQ